MNISIPTTIEFILISITTVFIFYLATQKNKRALLLIVAIAAVQATLAYIGFYSAKPLVPSKIPLMLAPTLITILIIMLTKRGWEFTKKLNLKTLTLLHTIRIPVEIVLYLLFTEHAIPEVMTFAGRNFDILAGLTAPIIYYFAFIKKSIGRKGLLIWNIICLALLVNIITTAVLSLELPFQQFGSDQPNEAILYFPIIWLPTIVVPIVIFTHIATIKRLLRRT